MQKKIPKLQKISTLIWSSQYEILKEMADKEDSKMAAIIRKALNRYLDENRKDDFDKTVGFVRLKSKPQSRDLRSTEHPD